MDLIPAQVEGAQFLASRKAALLADKPGFGKTAQAVRACDFVEAQRIIVVTTASARANWLDEFRKWARRERRGFLIYTGRDRIPAGAQIVVVSWSLVSQAAVLKDLCWFKADALILDEAHYAKTPSAARTKAVYGQLAKTAAHVWCLTGTPVTNTPLDLYPMFRALFPMTKPGGMTYEAFLGRYVATKPMWFGGRRVDVPTGAKNTDELAAALKPIMLRRDGDKELPPIRYNTVLVECDDATTTETSLSAETVRQVLDAAERGATMDVDMHLGSLRRVTGVLKARAAGQLVRDDLDGGLDKIVVFFWHKEVGAELAAALAEYGAVGIDGSTPADKRVDAVHRFQNDPECRVFLGQIAAAGEAITLTAANQCLFVEASFTPAHMAQAVRRIFRRGQTRPCLCRVAALRGSIDEALMRIVTRKVGTIREILED